MTAEYITALLGLVGSVGAVVGLVWAIRHRQLKTGDQAMYEAMADDEPDYTGMSQSAAFVSRQVRWLYAAVMLLVLLVVTCLIIQTVRIGTRAVPPPPIEQRLPSSE